MRLQATVGQARLYVGDASEVLRMLPPRFNPGIRFASRGEAEAYGADLQRRFGGSGHTVEESGDPTPIATPTVSLGGRTKGGPMDRALHEQKMLQDSDEFLALWRLHTQVWPSTKAAEPSGSFPYQCGRCGMAIRYPTHYCTADP